MNGFKPLIHEIDGCADWVAQTVWYRIFLRDLLGNSAISRRRPALGIYCSSLLISLVVICKGSSITWTTSLVELGLTGLYLCPIWISEQPRVRYHWLFWNWSVRSGDKKTFRQLVKEAHARGWRSCWCKAVFNHIGYDSPQWQDGQTRGGSIYKGLVPYQRVPVSSENLWNSRDLSYHACLCGLYALSSVICIIQRWRPISLVGCDLLDWRVWYRCLDWTANEIDHQFGEDFRKAVLAKKPDLYILGEIQHRPNPGSMAWVPCGAELFFWEYQGIISCGDIRRRTLIGRSIAAYVLQAKQISEVMFNPLDPMIQSVSWTTNRQSWAISPSNLASPLSATGNAFVYIMERSFSPHRWPGPRLPPSCHGRRSLTMTCWTLWRLIQLRKRSSRVDPTW